MSDIWFSPEAPAIRSWPDSERFELSLIPVEIDVPGSSDVVEQVDHFCNVVVPPRTLNVFDVAVASESQSASYEFSMSQLGAIVSSDGQVRHATDDPKRDFACQVHVRSRYGAKVISGVITFTGDDTARSIAGFKQGFLSSHAHQNISNYYAAASVAMSSVQVNLSDAEANPDRVAQEIDMSWMSIRATDGHYFPCNLISERHAILAKHTGLSVGRRYVFRDKSNTLQYPNVESVRDLGDDIALLYFDRPVTNCANVKFLGAPLEHIPSTTGETTYYKVPALIALYNSFTATFPTGRKLMTAAVRGFDQTTIYVGKPGFSELDAFHPPGDPYTSTGMRPGDSGSPAFFPIVENGGTEVTSVIVTALYTAYTGPNYSAFIPQIESAMNEMKNVSDTNVYSVQLADVSQFVTVL